VGAVAWTERRRDSLRGKTASCSETRKRSPKGTQTERHKASASNHLIVMRGWGLREGYVEDVAMGVMVVGVVVV
jgi:hypothetical protein